ncbi:MAG: amidohydrolase family protein [Gemmatimonadaceae bacterium]
MPVATVFHGTRPPIQASLIVLIGLGLAAPTAPLPAQLGRPGAERATPSAYAITNARIVTAAPQGAGTIERGTIVIRNGVIQAVGPSVSTPADARVIDGNGLTVYPGFIDAHASLGIPAPRGQQNLASRFPGVPAEMLAFAAQQQGGGQQQQPSGAPNSLYPPGLQPEIRAIDQIRVEASAFESAHTAGITTSLTAPREGIFMGQSALISLAGDTPAELLVRSPVALHVGFTPLRQGTYPGSLLGVFASLRQMLLDAQHYGQLQAAYARNPRGMTRPQHDPSLAALQPVLAREMPVVMWAGTQREIERALDLAKEFNLRAILAGGNEAYKVVDRLRADGIPVIATLNFPRRPERQSEDADPEPVRVLRERAEAPKNPGRLAQAGIRFAFTDGGMSNLGTDFLSNLRSAVDNGLPQDQAVRALTIDAARILGAEDRIGSIEVGKIANLTLVRGPSVFDRNARVTQVFIDGRPIEVRAPAARGEGGSGIASGTWTITATTDQGEKTLTLSLQQEGERLRGSIQGDLGSGAVANASIGENGDFRFTASINIGGETTEATFGGTITGTSMRGTVAMVGRPTGTFEGTKAGGGRRPGGGEAPPQRPPRR